MYCSRWRVVRMNLLRYESGMEAHLSLLNIVLRNPPENEEWERR
jgi:hypothetical protein